jgi:hypothetical protein
MVQKKINVQMGMARCAVPMRRPVPWVPSVGIVTLQKNDFGKKLGLMNRWKFKFQSSLVTFGHLWSSPGGRTIDEKALTGKKR